MACRDARYSAAALGNYNGPSLKLGQDIVAPSNHVRVLGVTFVWPESGWSRCPCQCNVFLLAPSVQTSSTLIGRRRHEDAGPCLHYFARGLLQRSSCRRLAGSPKYTTDTLERVLIAAARLVTNTPSTTVTCREYFMTSYTGSTSPSESSAILLLWFAGVWRTKLRRTWTTTTFRSPPSAADTYDQPTSIYWLCRTVSELHSVAGLTVWNSLPIGVRDLSVSFGVLGALLRGYYLRDITAFSAIEMYAWYRAI